MAMVGCSQVVRLSSFCCPHLNLYSSPEVELEYGNGGLQPRDEALLLLLRSLQLELGDAEAGEAEAEQGQARARMEAAPL